MEKDKLEAYRNAVIDFDRVDKKYREICAEREALIKEIQITRLEFESAVRNRDDFSDEF